MNDGSIEGLRPYFGGGRPPKLSPAQFAELCEILEEGQPWTPQQIHALIEDRYGVTYHPAHFSLKLCAAGMNYAKPRPMDPRRPEDAGEDEEADPVVLGFFREAWPQPFENSQRLWSFDRTVTIEKPVITSPWRSIGFYALTG